MQLTSLKTNSLASSRNASHFGTNVLQRRLDSLADGMLALTPTSSSKPNPFNKPDQDNLIWEPIKAPQWFAFSTTRKATEDELHKIKTLLTTHGTSVKNPILVRELKGSLYSPAGWLEQLSGSIRQALKVLRQPGKSQQRIELLIYPDAEIQALDLQRLAQENHFFPEPEKARLRTHLRAKESNFQTDTKGLLYKLSDTHLLLLTESSWKPLISKKKLPT